MSEVYLAVVFFKYKYSKELALQGGWENACSKVKIGTVSNYGLVNLVTNETNPTIIQLPLFCSLLTILCGDYIVAFYT